MAASNAVMRAFAPRRIGAIYVWMLIVLIFALWIPELFLRSSTPQTILNQSTVTAIVALSVVFPLVVGVFDLSVGAMVGLSAVVAAWFLGNTALPVPMVVLLTLLVGVFVGLLNSFVVLKLGIDSFIGTLATGAILGALTIAVSDNKIMTEGISGDFSALSAGMIGGLQFPVFYMLLLMIVQGILLERTRPGRLMYAVGFGPEATRLAGVSVTRLKVTALVSCSVIAAFAGLVLLGRVQAADPMGGVSYMIPAFSAAFLGATQFRDGRFNPWGTVVAVLLLATGSYGLLLSGIGQWAPQVFQGIVLIAAVGVTVAQRRVKPVRSDDPPSPAETVDLSVSGRAS
ncbi:ABC transporter permease [Salinibacterium sp. ZJ70]|uniref:ABC transporter permease n=1 Tax=Salinibacterium sp. ZJ70 TaxID=2708084 RepID=UPI00141DE556|nr:ABC transporter permease [Salinibacterium sp. ZJ70]